LSFPGGTVPALSSASTSILSTPACRLSQGHACMTAGESGREGGGHGPGRVGGAELPLVKHVPTWMATSPSLKHCLSMVLRHTLMPSPVIVHISLGLGPHSMNVALQ
jgi:hypothetical protein